MNLPPEEQEKSEERPAACSTSTPKKRLTLTFSAKEKLLNWDAEVRAEEANAAAENTHPDKDQVEASSVNVGEE